MPEITRKQLVDALGDVLDGSNEYDIQNSTGLELKRCREILDIFENVKKEWLND